MKKLNLFLRKSFDKQIDGTGLAVYFNNVILRIK
jgi:hypothetical protein